MKRILLLGDPVAHSKSPTFQTAGIRACGLDAAYDCRRVESAEEMRSVAESCRVGELHGANITLPHKSVAASLADVVTQDVESVGVANTWWTSSGKLHADNTDIYGIQAAVAALGVPRIETIVILGAGGAAAGALFALRSVATTVSIVNRTLSKAQELAMRASTFLDANVAAFSWPNDAQPATPELVSRFADADLIIQATSLPVHRATDPRPYADLPWSALSASVGLLELCYAPKDTVAMQRAKALGLHTVDGATMLLHQGLRSFERWFNVTAPAVVMRDALAEALGRPASAIPAIPEEALLSELLGG